MVVNLILNQFCQSDIRHFHPVYQCLPKQPGWRGKSMLCRGSVLIRQHLCGTSLSDVRGHGGVTSSHTHVRHLQYRLTGSFLTGSWSGVTHTVAGAGLVRGAGGVGGAELHSRGVLQRVLASLHLKGCRPHPHQPPLLAPLGLAGHVGRGPPADHAARCEESQSYQ